MFFHFPGKVAAQGNLSADKVLEKAAAVISDSKGISVQFSMSGNNLKGNGTIKGVGGKFYISLPEAQIWYNGKDLYTYNARTSETMLIKPTKEELQESNPLLYVNSYKGKYSSSYAPNKQSGKYIINLQPTVNNDHIKKLTITINSSSFRIEKIEATMGNGGNLKFDVTSFKNNLNIPASDFEYPKNKFPNVEIIDMR